jgi:predicted RND superfamily exporter protein
MYAWLVALHLVGFVVFLVCHAVSMWVAFRIRSEPDRAVIAAMLEMSSRGNQVMYLGLILLGVGGLGAASVAGWLTAPWVVASYAVVAVTLVAMWAMGAGFYYPLREGLEGTEKTPRLEDEALRATIAASRRPEALAAIGFTSLLILVLLMVLKPA